MLLILWGREGSSGGDAELDAAAQPPGQAGRDAARGPVHHRFPVTDGEGQPDRQIGPVRAAGGQAEPGDRGSAATAASTAARTSGSSCGGGTGWPAGERRQPGALDRERHRPGHVDDDRAAVRDGGAPHPVRLRRHRAGVAAATGPARPGR